MEAVGAWGWQGKDAAPKKYVCKFCKVQVCSKTNPAAVTGKEHKKCCPRRKTGH